jgi:DUF917 family protein
VDADRRGRSYPPLHLASFTFFYIIGCTIVCRDEKDHEEMSGTVIFKIPANIYIAQVKQNLLFNIKGSLGIAGLPKMKSAKYRIRVH